METIDSIITFVESYRLNRVAPDVGVLTPTQLEEFARELQAKIAELPRDPIGKAADATAIAYEGKIGDIEAWKLAKELSENSNGTKYYISDTLPGQLLNDADFKAAVERTVGSQLVAERLIGGTVQKVRIDQFAGAGELLSINDFVSKRFAENARGAVTLIVENIKPNSVLALTELPTFGANTAVTTIAGMSRDTYNDFFRVHPQAVAVEESLKALKGHALMDSGYLFITRPDGQHLSILHYITERTPPATLRQTLKEAASALGNASLRALHSVSVIGDLIGFYSAAADAQVDIKAGRYGDAGVRMSQWGVQYAAGMVGAEAGSAVAGMTFAPLLLAGPVGAGAWAVLTALGGIAGWFLGDQAVEELFAPFGEGGEWNLSGTVQVAMQDDAVGLMFRHVLNQLQPEESLRGPLADPAALALYNPETGTGVITREWVEARATMMVALIEYHEHKNDFDHQLSKPFALPFNFWGNIVMTDAANPSFADLTIDGWDVGVADPRYIRFGDVNANELVGGVRDDRLFGGEGDDVLTGGADGDAAESDYLEGGLGDDTYVYQTGDGQDVIRDVGGFDHIKINGTELSGNFKRYDDPKKPGAQSWSNDGFGTIVLTLLDGTLGNGTLEISGVGVGGDGKITIDNYVNSQFGFVLEHQNSVKGLSGNNKVPEGGQTGIRITLDGSATRGEKMEISVGPDQAGRLLLIDGDHQYAFGSDGKLQLDLNIGQSVYEYSLKNFSDVESDIDFQFSAVVLDEFGNPVEDTRQSKDMSIDAAGGQTGYRIPTRGSLADAYYVLDHDPDYTPTAPRFIGTDAAELILGNGRPDVGDYIDGGAGDDFIISSMGADTILGGDGNDYIRGSHSAGWFAGFNWDVADQYPFIIHSGAWGILDAGNGNYIPLSFAYGGTGFGAIAGDSGNEIDGGAGNDDIEAGSGADSVHGGADNDNIRGGAKGDTIFGDSGDDKLYGDGFDNGSYAIETTPISEHGDDIIYGGDGNDFMWGQGGHDSLYGGAGNDQIVGDDFNTGVGNDFISGDAGADNLFGGAGNDTLLGGADNDQLTGDGAGGDPNLDGDDVLDGGAGDDALRGGGGNDRLIGGDGADTLFGDAGSLSSTTTDDDYLDGGAGDDGMVGGRGNDHLVGGAGNDYLEGDEASVGEAQAGDDVLDGGDGDDNLVGGFGRDILSGDAGDDLLWGGGGNDALRGGDGDDQLSGDAGNDLLEGGSGDDYLLGGDGDDVLIGGDGTDTLDGGDGNDQLVSDGQNELLRGGAGNDTYIVNGNGSYFIVDNQGVNDVILTGVAASEITSRIAGGQVLLQAGGITVMQMDEQSFRTLGTLQIDAEDVSWNATDVQQTFRPGASLTDTISLNAGVATSDISYYGKGDDLILLYSGSVSDWVNTSMLLGAGVMWSVASGESLGLAAGTKALVLTNWYLSSGGSYVSVVQDSNSQRQNFTSLAAAAPRLVFGTAGDDELDGSDKSDVMRGNAGSDLLTAGAGNDSLEGGDGNDTLFGADGNDTYIVGAATGIDTIYDNAGTDSLRFNSGVAPADVSIIGSGSSIIVQVGAAAANNRVEILDANQNTNAGIERIEFADGTVWNAADIQSRMTGDRRPVLANPLADVEWAAGQPASLTIPSNTFSDPNAGDTLALRALMQDGSALPAWLTFDAATRTLSGTPPASTVGQLQISIWAKDPTGLVAADNFELSYGSLEVTGTEASEGLYGTNAREIFRGLGGDDWIYAGGGNDVLIGGPGNDSLSGDAGNDKFVYNLGDGVDTILGYSQPSDVDTIEFGAGIAPSSVTFELWNSQSLLIRINGQGAMVVNSFFDPRYVDDRVSGISFAGSPGVFISRSQIDAMVMVPTESGDYLRGTNSAETIAALGGNDTVYGVGGDDTLLGGAGQDFLDGGAGNDTLLGGDDNDTYWKSGGEGNDVINDSGGDLDTLKFGYDIDPATIVIRGVGTSLFVDIVGGMWFPTTTEIINGNVTGPNQIERIYFHQSGVVWDAAQIEARTTGDRRPVVTSPIADQAVGPGTSLSLQIPAGMFTDPNPGDSVTITVGLENGAALPSWLGYDAATRILSGTPAQGASGTLQIAVKGTDTTGAYASDVFQLFYGSPLIQGTQGNDDGYWTPAVIGTPLGDRIEGLGGNDLLQGLGGNDTLVGGLGGDDLEGGPGDDKYVFNRGDGWDEIEGDAIMPGDVETLEFGPGILPGELTFIRSYNDLTIRLASSGDNVSEQDFLTPGAFGARLSRITFVDAPGVVITSDQIDAMLMVPTSDADYLRGTMGNDTISGLAGTDTIFGMAGDDVLNGGADQDTLDGGDGNDTLDGGIQDNTLIGGAGNDTYLWSYGSGNTIIETTGSLAGDLDTLRFGPGVSSNDVKVVHDYGNDLYVMVSPSPYITPVSIILRGDAADVINAPGVDELRFTDEPGTILSTANLRARSLMGGNDNETLRGFSSDDTIRGGGGNDTLMGGAGADTYQFGIGQGTDTIDDISGSNRIQLDAGINPANVSVYRVSSRSLNEAYIDGDSLVVSINGGTDQIWVQNYFGSSNRTALAEIRFGDGTVWNGAAILANLTNLSGTANTQTGTTGNDTFTVDHRDDVISETSGGGTDTVNASVSHALNNNVENLTLTGNLNTYGRGNSLANVITGNSGSNYLYGGDANDTLSGGAGNDRLEGGAGDDTLVGGTGDDYYVVENTQTGFNWSSSGLQNIRDVVTEAAGEGIDTIYADRVYSLTMASNVENLIVYRVASFSGTFNATEDVRRKFTGNALDNVIDARLADHVGIGVGTTFVSGGAGAEIVLDGGLGDDVLIGGNYLRTRFIVDSLGDSVYGNSMEDTVETALSYTIGSSVDNLTLVGSSAVSGTGNAGNNILDGTRNTAANVLTGGAGDDTYLLGAGDTAVELADGGSDTIQLAASGTYSVDSYVNIENLALLDSAGSSTLNGNAANNNLTGNTGNNTLFGGAGSDRLSGLTGSDSYTGFGATSGNDVIVDTGGSDSIVFSSSENLSVDAFQFSRSDSDLLITVSPQSSIRLQSWYSNGNNVIENFYVYKDGLAYLYTGAELAARAAGTNSAPRAGFLSSVPDAGVGAPFSYQFAGNSFLDIDSQSSLTYSVSMAGGGALPSWLSFDAATRTLSGTPTDEDFIDLRLTATDAGGLSATANVGFSVNVLPINGTAGPDTIAGTSGNDEIYGFEGNDSLSGLEGDDYLDGGADNDVMNGGPGGDYMYGDAGNDIYYVDSVDDTVDEPTGMGTDEVRSTITINLATLGWTGIENVTLLGTDAINATGNNSANVLIGNSAANILSGGSGSDTLDGGAGADDMTGGSGNDTFVVDNVSDIVRESSGGGTDTIQSSITLASLAANVENVTLIGIDNIDAVGGSGANTLTGNSGNNRLNGGAGSDTMIGGLGDDTYVVDTTSDTVTEVAGQGTDTVETSVSFSINSGTMTTTIENLSIVNSNTSTGITLTGNGLNNVITGSSVANTLTGNDGDDTLYGLGGNDTLNGGNGNDILDGGAGNDGMTGGAGNDTYFVDSTTDTVTEGSGAGTDTIQTTVQITTWAANVENMTLLGSNSLNITGTTANNVLIGNSGANNLNGGNGDDTINGMGGADVLTGGLGADIYQYASGGGADTIDNSSSDSLIDRLQFTDLASGAITFSKSGNHLVMTRTGTTDTVTVSNWFSATGNRLDFVNFTNVEKTAAQIDALFAGGGTGGVFTNGAAPAATMAKQPSTDIFEEIGPPDSGGGGPAYRWEPIKDFEVSGSASSASYSLADSLAAVPGGKGTSPHRVPIKTFLTDSASTHARAADAAYDRLVDAIAAFGEAPMAADPSHAEQEGSFGSQLAAASMHAEMHRRPSLLSNEFRSTLE